MRPSPGLARHRARWHGAACTVTRPSGPPTFNPTTGAHTPAAPTVVYSGACIITPDGSAGVQNFGDGPTVTRTATVDLADLATVFAVEDVVTVTECADATWVGAELRVLDIARSELITVRRLTCEEVL